jgi:hypothetical protein
MQGNRAQFLCHLPAKLVAAWIALDRRQVSQSFPTFCQLIDRIAPLPGRLCQFTNFEPAVVLLDRGAYQIRLFRRQEPQPAAFPICSGADAG